MKYFKRSEGVNNQKQGLADSIGVKQHLIHWAMESQKGLIVKQFQEWSKGQVIYIKRYFRLNDGVED